MLKDNKGYQIYSHPIILFVYFHYLFLLSSFNFIFLNFLSFIYHTLKLIILLLLLLSIIINIYIVDLSLDREELGFFRPPQVFKVVCMGRVSKT